MNYITELLNKSHDRKNFTSGQTMLDTYLQRQARQDVKRKLSACFVLTDPHSITIKAYYTLSNCSISLKLFPNEIRKKLPPSYSAIPTTLLGRLAVSIHFQKQGLGKLMLIDALKRSLGLSKKIGSFAVIVDPIDEPALNFYLKYGFILLPSSGKMMLAMKTIEKLFE